MSMSAYFDKLDLDQLFQAKRLIEERIAQKQQEKKRVVWCVEDDSIRHAFFREDEYLLAAEKLLELARENEKSEEAKGVIAARDKKLYLVPIFVIESEYEGYFA